MAACERCKRRSASRTSITGRKLCVNCWATITGASVGAVANPQSPVAGGLQGAAWGDFLRKRLGKKK